MRPKKTKNLFHEQDFFIIKAVLDQSTEGFSLLDSDGQYVGVNQAFCDITGYSEAELLSMKISDLLPPGKQPKLFPKVAKGIGGEQRIEIFRKDATLLQAYVKASSITHNNQTYILGIVNDITSQFEAEGNFHISEKKYRTLFDSAPDPIVIHDGEIILDLNQSALTALSLTKKEQVIGQDPFALLHPDDRELAHKRLIQLKEDGKPIVPAEFRIKLPNNEIRTVLATPIAIEFGDKQAFMVNYHDITKRNATREQLNSSKEFAENLMETANTMVVAFDVQARITTFNKYAEDLTGYKKAEVLGENWFDLFITELDHKTIPIIFSDVLQQMPRASQHENYIRIKGGEKRLISWSNNVMLSPTGVAQGVLSIGIDITERKQAAEALRISEEHYRNVVQDQTEYIMRYLPDGSITFVNDSFCRAFNTSLEEAMGKNVKRGKLDTEVERIARKIEAISTDNSIITDEHISITPSGETAWHLWTDRGIFDEQGVLTEIQAVGRDITERKRMEESLQASSTQLEEAQRMANMGSYVVDLTTSMWTNSMTLDDIFGINQTFVRDTEGWLSLMHPSDREEVDNYYHSCLQTKRKHYDKEYRIIRNNDKSIRWIHGLAEFEYDEENNPIGMRGIIHDITDRKLAEEQRERALSDAHMAGQVKDQFIANISHEIRTPLNSILGFSDILNQRYNDVLGEGVENVFDYISVASKRLMRTV